MSGADDGLHEVPEVATFIAAQLIDASRRPRAIVALPHLGKVADEVADGDFRWSPRRTITALRIPHDAVEHLQDLAALRLIRGTVADPLDERTRELGLAAAV